MLVLLIIFRRWRHLFTFFASLLVAGILGLLIYLLVQRPRPYGVTIIGDWTGFAAPSFPILTLAAGLIGFTYSMVVPGRPREWAKLGTGVVIAVVAFARLYLAVDHPPTSSGRSSWGWRSRSPRSAGSPRTRPSR